MIASAEVWRILSGAEKVYVASGQKTLTYEPHDSNRGELLKKATGRTGNLRAPALKIGNELYVGFNVLLYENLAK